MSTGPQLTSASNRVSPIANNVGRTRAWQSKTVGPSAPFCQAMASILDSTAEFSKRCQELLPADQATKLEPEDIKTFGGLAFAVAEQPDRISESKFTALLKKCFGNTVTLGVESALRRLAFEGLTHSLQDIKLRSDGDAAASRPVPTFEREDLRAAQVAKLKGILIEGELEPALPRGRLPPQKMVKGWFQGWGVEVPALILHFKRFIAPLCCFSLSFGVRSSHVDV